MQQKSLVIVESPTKIKTLKQILGPNFIFESSYGHIRDLPENDFGIDFENNFEPTYVPMKDKSEVIKRLQAAAKSCEVVYLCPDPDREGEAIAWHISQLIGKNKNIKRATFQSITKDAVVEALKHPKEIDLALVNAQQARRILDRIVGYSISPLLNRRLRRGRNEPVSAGRVQSVALKLVVDREREIEAFIPREYWNIEAVLCPLDKKTKEPLKSFKSFLHSIEGKRVEKEIPEGKEKLITTISNEADAKKIISEVEKASFTVLSIEKKDRKRQPEAPFTTSTLQQEASRHFRFSPSRTMEVAQSLYEGVEIGNRGIQGLITYMRTDSVRVAPEALNDLRSYISSSFGKENLNPTPRSFQMKKSAQDAHEAIRPADVSLDPETLKKYLTRDQHLLYMLIWKRYVASQMANAIYDTLTYDIKAGDKYIFRATGSRLRFSGFLSVYEEKKDEDEDESAQGSDKEFEAILPEVHEGETLRREKIDAIQSFTRPPPRFTEATLVKELEKSGIGRPSTYASIMKKISERDYTEKEQGRLKPTELGRIVTEMLESHFQTIMNVGFTASMEDSLESVAENKLEWHSLLKEFWDQFSTSLGDAKEKLVPPKVMTDIPCPKCGSPLQKIWFKSKYFLGCSKYPDCDFSGSLEEMSFDKSLYEDGFDWDQPCPKCGSQMKVRFGKFGAFLGCTQYPKCRGIVSIPKKGEGLQPSSSDKESAIPCPAKGCHGTLSQRRSRFGKLFWSCSEFPDCDVIGDSIEVIQEKFKDREKTAYQKREKASKKSSSTTRAKTTAATKKSKKSLKVEDDSSAEEAKTPSKKTKSTTKKVATKSSTKKTATASKVVKKAKSSEEPKKATTKKTTVKKTAAKKKTSA